MADSEQQQQQQETMDTTEQQQQSEQPEQVEGAPAAPADNKDEDDRKLFVGGLPQDAKEAEIKDHFSNYGAIESVTLKTDPHTGRSRGFAFVVFETLDGVQKAVDAEEHTLKGKKVAVKKAQAKQGKVYVGKLKPEVSDDDVKEFFAQYGTIATIEQPFDKVKNERKNFCFITFEKEEPAKKLLKEGTVTINGHELEVKKVTPKPDPRMAMGMRGGGRGGGGGGVGGPWGGYGGGQWGGYGDYWGGYGYGPESYYGGQGGWGGYGGGQGGWGGYGGQGNGFAGKAPRGRGGGAAAAGGNANRGRGGGAAARGQRQKPY